MYMETLTMTKYCVGCGEPIHPKRVEILPNVKTCVSCSNTGMKRGITVLNGDVEKDDTWVDIVFLEEDEFQAYEQAMGRMKKTNNKASKAEFQNYDDDDNVSMPSFDDSEE